MLPLFTRALSKGSARQAPRVLLGRNQIEYEKRRRLEKQNLFISILHKE